MRITNPSFKNATDADFENRSTNVSVQLGDKTVIAARYPGLAQLQAAVKTFSETLAQSSDRGRTAIAKKNAARRSLEKELIKAAIFVEMNAVEDSSLIVACGFEGRKPRQPRTTITAPENIQAESGNNPGEILVSVKTKERSRMKSFEYTADPLTDTSTWITGMDTRSSHLFDGLKPGQKYWFRVATIGKGGSKAYSNTISCFVQ